MASKKINLNGHDYKYGDVIQLDGLYPFSIASPSDSELEIHEPKHTALSDKSFNALFDSFANDVENFSGDPVMYLSSGNSKTHTYSISLAPLFTCGNAGMVCGKSCYACRGCATYRKKYNYRDVSNTVAFMTDPGKYLRTLVWIINAIDLDYFRYNVDGDIAIAGYHDMIIAAANACTNCDFLLFTKQYDIVNRYLNDHNGDYPENLHTLYSIWDGIPHENPYGLPECHLQYANGGFVTIDIMTKDPLQVTYCPGDCSICQRNCNGCFHAVRGDVTIIKEH